MDDDDDPLVCRICGDEDVRSPLLQPCDCVGSMSAVHLECLHRWIQTRTASDAEGGPASLEEAMTCEVCQARYRVQYEQVVPCTVGTYCSCSSCWLFCEGLAAVFGAVSLVLIQTVFFGGPSGSESEALKASPVEIVVLGALNWALFAILPLSVRRTVARWRYEHSKITITPLTGPAPPEELPAPAEGDSDAEESVALVGDGIADDRRRRPLKLALSFCLMTVIIAQLVMSGFAAYASTDAYPYSNSDDVRFAFAITSAVNGTLSTVLFMSIRGWSPAPEHEEI